MLQIYVEKFTIIVNFFEKSGFVIGGYLMVRKVGCGLVFGSVFVV